MHPDYTRLIESSIEAKRFSYSPYSKFSVGAALLTSDNKIYLGTNIECASYSLCICAERVAFVKAISEGKKDFRAIAISSSIDEFVYPCGACRQFMNEFSGNLDVIVIRSLNDVKITKLSDLIPEAFTKNSLK